MKHFLDHVGVLGLWVAFWVFPTEILSVTKAKWARSHTQATTFKFSETSKKLNR